MPFWTVWKDKLDETAELQEPDLLVPREERDEKPQKARQALSAFLSGSCSC